MVIINEGAISHYKQVLINEGVIPHLIKLLQSSSNNIKKEILKILIEIASGRNEQKEKLIKDTVMRRFRKLLQSSENELIKLTVKVILELAKGTDPVKQVLIKKGIIQRLIQLLPSTPDLTTQRILEILIKIAIGNKNAVMNGGAVTHYVTLLQSSDNELIERTVKLIRELAKGTNDQKKVLIDAGVIPRFVELLQSPSILDFNKQTVLKYLIDFAKKSSEQTNQIIQAGAIPYFIELLNSPNEVIVGEAASGLSNILAGTEEQTDQVIEAGVIPHFIRLLGSRNEVIAENTARGLSNILAGTDEQTDQVIEAGVIPLFIDLLESKNEYIVGQAARGLTDILAGTEEQTDQVIQAGVIPHFIRLLGSRNEVIAENTARGLYNILLGTPEQINEVIQAGIIPRLIDLLESKNNFIVAAGSNNRKNLVIEVLRHSASFLTLEHPDCEQLCKLIANIAAGYMKEQKQIIINENLLIPLKNLLDPSYPSICKQAVEALFQIACGSTDQREAVIESGGLAQAGGHTGQLKTKEDSEGRHAYLKADNKYTLDTIAKGPLKSAQDSEFMATNERFDFNLKPNSHNNNSGDGTVSFNDKEKGKSGKYGYTIRQDGRRTEADLSAHDIGNDQFAQSLFGRRSDKYHCTAETPGVSQCYDAQGRSVGKVVADKNGNTVVYNDKDVPIGTGSVRKINDRSYEAVISKNLFIARLKDVRRGACCKQITGQECAAPIKLSNPKFSSASERDEEGKVHLTWPDCFDMSVDVTLPPNVHINKLAMKLDVNIQPLGKLRCMDVATCGRECYYCD
uniref:Uncharacterized protein n=1 Tax=Panagrolaimus sp. JU765 TaxID=591449 RepID=A0AC34RGX9_9BILA